MAIAIPAIVDTQLAALKASMSPHNHVDGGGTTHTQAAGDLFPRGNRVADILRLLTGLIDSGTLTVQGIHGATDAADDVATANAVDPATGYALSIALKNAYNLHIAKVAGDVHWGVDAANAADAPDADSEGKLVTLTNQLKEKFSAHAIYLTGNTHRFPDTKRVYLPADCTTYATAYVILNALKPIYNAHIIDIGCSNQALGDTGAFVASSLIGAKITFGPATATVALRGAVAYVGSNTTDRLNFKTVLPGTPVTADVYAIEYASVDDDLAMIDGGKGFGGSQSNPYGYGPSLLNACIKLIVQLGGTLPTYLVRVTDGTSHHTTFDPAEAFGIGSPHAGGSAYGHGGGILVADMLQRVRDQVALFTVPA